MYKFTRFHQMRKYFLTLTYCLILLCHCFKNLLCIVIHLIHGLSPSCRRQGSTFFLRSFTCKRNNSFMYMYMEKCIFPGYIPIWPLSSTLCLYLAVIFFTSTQQTKSLGSMQRPLCAFQAFCFSHACKRNDCYARLHVPLS